MCLAMASSALSHSSDHHSFTSLHSVLSGSLLLPNPLSFEGEEKSDQTKEWLFDWLKGRKETIRLLVEVARNVDRIGGVAGGSAMVNATVQAEVMGNYLFIFF
jgi:hypothetical protein